MKIETNGKKFIIEVNEQELRQLWANSLTAYAKLNKYAKMPITKEIVETIEKALTQPF